VKVLIVDDEPDIRGLLRVMLEAERWTVEESASGEEALDAWEEVAPDIIVTDNVMPGITGMELAVSLRQRGFGGPLLLFSAYLDKALTQKARAAGIVSVSKVEYQSLMRVLRALAIDLEKS
jgi:CheY-like chemotaxis protein